MNESVISYAPNVSPILKALKKDVDLHGLPSGGLSIPMWEDSGKLSDAYFINQSRFLPALIQNDCVVEWLEFADSLSQNGRLTGPEITAKIQDKISQTFAEEGIDRPGQPFPVFLEP